MSFELRTTIGMDVESARDFYQYYNRHRTFGWRNPEIHHTKITPSQLHRAEDDSTIGVMTTNPATFEPALLTTSWKVLRVSAVGGSPMLGNIPLGDTYVYLSKVARREPAKGFAVNETEGIFPDPRYCAQYALNKIIGLTKASRQYASRIPIVSDILNRYLTVNVYNREYPESLSAALDLLESGNKVAIALSPDVGLYFKKGSTEIHVSFRGKFDGVGRVDTSRRLPEIILDQDPTGLLRNYMQSFNIEERG